MIGSFQFLTLVRFSDPCTNHSHTEAGEHNHQAPRNICAGISNQEDLKYENIKEQLNGKHRSGCNTSQGYNFWRVDEVFGGVDSGQDCATRPKNDKHTHLG
jgi:hypothetical protein